MPFVEIKFRQFMPTDTLQKALRYLDHTKTHQELAQLIRQWLASPGDPPQGMDKLVQELADECDAEFKKNGHQKEGDPGFLMHVTAGVLNMHFRGRREDEWIEKFIQTDTQLAGDLQWAIRTAVELWARDNVREDGLTPNRNMHTPPADGGAA